MTSIGMDGDGMRRSARRRKSTRWLIRRDFPRFHGLPSIETVETESGRRLVPVDQLERFVAERRQKAQAKSRPSASPGRKAGLTERAVLARSSPPETARASAASAGLRSPGSALARVSLPFL
jgi:hypothetical protein